MSDVPEDAMFARRVCAAIDGGARRDDIVPIYAEMISAGVSSCRATNEAILSNWKRGGLTYIKAKAWEAVTP